MSLPAALSSVLTIGEVGSTVSDPDPSSSAVSSLAEEKLHSV